MKIAFIIKLFNKYKQWQINKNGIFVSTHCYNDLPDIYALGSHVIFIMTSLKNAYNSAD